MLVFLLSVFLNSLYVHSEQPTRRFPILLIFICNYIQSLKKLLSRIVDQLEASHAIKYSYILYVYAIITCFCDRNDLTRKSEWCNASYFAAICRLITVPAYLRKCLPTTTTEENKT